MKKFFEKLFKRFSYNTPTEDAFTTENQVVTEASNLTSLRFRKEREQLGHQLQKMKKGQRDRLLEAESINSITSLFETTGEVLYLPSNFPLQEGLEQLTNLLKAQEGIEVSYTFSQHTQVHTVQFKDTTTFRRFVRASPSFQFIVQYTTPQVTFGFALGEIENSSENTQWWLLPTVLIFYRTAVNDFWQEILAALVSQHYEIAVASNELFPDTHLVPDGRYTQDFSLRHLLWVLAQAYQTQSAQDALAWLPLQSVNIPTVQTPNEPLHYYFTCFASRSMLLGFQKNGYCSLLHPLSHTKVEVSQQRKNYRFVQEDCTWEADASVGKLLHELLEGITLQSPEERLQHIALLNWHHHADDDQSNSFALIVMKKKALLTQDVLDKLTVTFLAFASENRKKALSPYLSADATLEVLRDTLQLERLGEVLPRWMATWKVSLNDTITILRLLVKLKEHTEQLAVLLPFHREIREQFLQANKRNYQNPEVILLELQFCEYLLAAGENEEAIVLLDTLRSNLPDETLADLLPPSDANLSEHEGGPPIRVNLLELMIRAKGIHEAHKEVIELAQLQPLYKQRLNSLVKYLQNDRIVRRAKEVIRILASDGMAPYYSLTDEKGLYSTLPTEVIHEKLVHPATQSKGAFHSLKEWVASVPVPDYSHLKQYTEQLGNHPLHSTYQEILADIQVAFNMPGVEAYIARGEKSVGIQAFEGNPSFIIIGNNHLEEKSVFYMTPLEMRFALGAEMAHLYFKHARITSQDVWQGAWQKGKIVLDTLLMSTGTLQALSGVLGKTATLGNLLRRTEKISMVASTGNELLSWLRATTETYSNPKEEREILPQAEQLLATSRLLQLTADRSGLLMCGNLHAVIRAIFLTQRAFVAELPVVQRYGLTEVITRQNSAGEYVFQHLAIRLASLISFYLSEEFDQLERLLFAKE